MKITTQMVRIVQSHLNAKVNAGLTVDGHSGPQTIAACLRFPTISGNWTPVRIFVGAIQHIATVEGFEAGPIDGYWGSQTAHGYNQLAAAFNNETQDNWRDKDDEVTYRWPRGTTSEMTNFFGPVGTNQSKVSIPYTLKLAWDTDKTLNRFTCHKFVVEPIQEAMEEILDVYGLDFIQENKLDHWGGALNVRKKRGGSNYSMHSWGTAIDWNPVDNRLRWGSDKAQLAQPKFEQFWQAWERQGAVSLGRAKNYDYMHLQFCTV